MQLHPIVYSLNLNVIALAAAGLLSWEQKSPWISSW